MNGRTLHERVAFEICKVKDLSSYALEISANEARVQKFSGTAVNSEFYSEAIENFWSTFVEKNGLKIHTCNNHMPINSIVLANSNILCESIDSESLR